MKPKHTKTAQRILAVDDDGIWGPRTRRAAIAYADPRGRRPPMADLRWLALVIQTAANATPDFPHVVSMDAWWGPVTEDAAYRLAGPEHIGFRPDEIAPPPTRSGYVERVRGRTPNRNAGVNTCEGIILHHCAGFFEGTISWCLRPKTFAGYHCLVAQDGTRAILATDEDRAHHAGRSVWRRRTGCNAFMLGLSFTGNTVTGARRPHAHLTGDEIASAREWMEGKMRKHRIARDAITTHAVVSPGRKDDISAAAFEQVMSGW